MKDAAACGLFRLWQCLLMKILLSFTFNDDNFSSSLFWVGGFGVWGPGRSAVTTSDLLLPTLESLSSSSFNISSFSTRNVGVIAV